MLGAGSVDISERGNTTSVPSLLHGSRTQHVTGIKNCVWCNLVYVAYTIFLALFIQFPPFLNNVIPYCKKAVIHF
jgi:hypothetical protein